MRYERYLVESAPRNMFIYLKVLEVRKLEHISRPRVEANILHFLGMLAGICTSRG